MPYSRGTQAIPTYRAQDKLLVYRRVKIVSGTADKKPPLVEVADAGEADIGETEVLVEAGELIAVRPAKDIGRHSMVSFDAFAAGVTLYGADGGTVSATISGDPVGTAVGAATSADEIIAVDRVI